MSNDTKRLLFVCTNNRMRSPTAEQIVSGTDGYEVRSAGVASSAEKQLRPADVEWADTIFAMEEGHRRALGDLMGGNIPEDTEVVVLGIPDRFPYMDEELIAILKRELAEYL